MRTVTTINLEWRFIKSSANAKEAAFTPGEPVNLPHTWNAADGQDGGNDYHRGTCWYVKKFKKPVLEKNGRAYLQFEAAAMTAEVYINHQKLTKHEGGFSTFRVDITDHLQEENILVVSVNNSDNDVVYPQKADFTFYGGIYRDVTLITVPEVHFAMNYDGAPPLKVTPIVKEKIAEVTVEAWLSGETDTIELTVDGQTQQANVIQGYAKSVFYLENPHLWDGRNDPYLYTVKAETKSGDKVSSRFGCRTFSVDPQKGFFLNGRPYPLRGVSMHQDWQGVGNALQPEMHQKNMDIICEMGANTIRLAHYQHSQYFYDLCDEKGMVVWAEIPYITQHMKKGRKNTLSQMQELVVQNYNHPSIFCWGLSNEISAASEVNEDLLENHQLLNQLCHDLDKTRPTVLANVFMLEIDNPILKIADLNSYNLYFGWYLGELTQNEEFLDCYHELYPDRCIGLSEYGADANPNFQTSHPERGDYTEQYQCVYHEHMLHIFETRPWLWATHVWNMFDFAADGRDEGGKHGINQKGLVTIDRELKKDSFYLYKAYWSQEPFVHICGNRYTERAEDVTEVKVYSNQPQVKLYVNGKLYETKNGKHIFCFHVPLSETTKIEARAGKCQSQMSIQRVSKPNPRYNYHSNGDIINWFEKEKVNTEYYSIGDTLGTLEEHPEAQALVQKLMTSANIKRGDVAESVKDNPSLKSMMKKTSLKSMIKQAGNAFSSEQIQNLNKALQKIKKR